MDIISYINFNELFVQEAKNQSQIKPIKAWLNWEQLSGVPLSDNIANLLEKTHSWVSDIVDIRVLEYQETNLFAIFGRAWKERIYNLLWINNIDPKVFAQITETLNKSRKAINDKQEPKLWKNDKSVSINIPNKWDWEEQNRYGKAA